jgi:hypothetical protein
MRGRDLPVISLARLPSIVFNFSVAKFFAFEYAFVPKSQQTMPRTGMQFINGVISGNCLAITPQQQQQQ